MAYYYINGMVFDEYKTKVEKLIGYLTDANHDSFFPPQDFPRLQVIEQIRKGDVFFLEDGAYHKIKIKALLFGGVEFLRVDNYPAPFDYFG